MFKNEHFLMIYNLTKIFLFRAWIWLVVRNDKNKGDAGILAKKNQVHSCDAYYIGIEILRS